MSRGSWGHAFLPAALLALGGCAGVDPRPDYRKAAGYIAGATGEESVYLPGDDEAARQRVNDLLSGGITADEAVQIALLNNPELQAAFLSIGLSRADVVQSGLLSNPSLTAAVRFPTGGGPTNVEADLVQNLIELWQLPARTRVATRQLHRTVLQVAHDAALLAARVKAAYFKAVASEAALEVERENLALIEDLLELTLQRQQAGAATEIDANLVRSERLQQEIVTRGARLAVLEAKRELALLEGLETPPEELTLVDALVDLPRWTLSLPGLLEGARSHRLDVRAAREAVEVARENLSLQQRLFLRHVSLGGTLESEGSDVAVGPAVGLEIPLFDQNQAQIAKAEFAVGQAERLLEAVTISMLQETRGAYERSKAAWDMAQSYSRRLVPLRKANLELARESFRLGQTGFLSVLEVQRTYLSARQQAIQQEEILSLALSDLQKAAAQPLSAILGGETREETPDHLEKRKGKP